MMKRVILGAGLMSCMLALAGCGGKGTTTDEVKTYQLEEQNFELGEEEYPSNFVVEGDSLYFLNNVSPKYPEEYYELLDKIQGQYDDMTMNDMMRKPEEEEDSLQDTTDGTDVDDGVTDDEFTDDDLLGDLDDIFNDGEEPDADEPEGNDKPEGPSEDGEEIPTYEELEEMFSDYKATIVLMKYDITTSELSTLFELESNENVYEYQLKEDGSCVMLLVDYNYDEATMTSNEKLRAVSFSSAGEILSDVPLEVDASARGEDSWLSSVIFNSEDCITVTYQANDKTKLYQFDSNGALLSDMELSSSLDSLVVANNGDIVTSTYTEAGISYNTLDFDKKELGPELKGIVEEGSWSNYQLMKGYGDAYLYLKDSTYLYKYDVDRQALLPIMKWIDSGMIGDNINQIVPYGDNYLCVYNEDRSSYKLGLLTAVTGEVVNKEAITIAMIYTDSNVQKAIVDYNKSSDKYKIELKTYENEEDPYTALSNDIIAGNVPDILETSNIDLRNYVAKGLLEDLTTFMDSDDTVTKDYFVDGLLDATAIDGKVYNITKFFNLMSIVGKDSDLQAYGDSWTAADMIEYYNSKPEGTSLFQYDSRESVFYTLVMYDLNSYINWETGEVSFDCDEFRNILEFVNKFDTEQDYDKEIDQHQMIKDGKILLETAYFGETTDFQMYKALFDNDIRYIGYPTSDGKGSYISTNYAYSITQTSKNKEEAWNFIKTVLQGKDEYYSGFPSSKVEFEKMIERDMTTEEYTDDDGNVVMPRESTYGFNNFEVKIGPAQEDEIQQLRDMIKNVRSTISYNSGVYKIVQEATEQFFKGEKTIDEMIDLLQDKMTKYVNENK